jgi:hypothetical protein
MLAEPRNIPPTEPKRIGCQGQAPALHSVGFSTATGALLRYLRSLPVKKAKKNIIKR